MQISLVLLILYTLSLILTPSSTIYAALYFPGDAPAEYNLHQPIGIKVSKVDSINTALPYSYYDFPFCRPSELIADSENLGEILGADRTYNSPYIIRMKELEACKILCKANYQESDIELFKKRIQQYYRVHMQLDSLPVATKYYIQQNSIVNNNDNSNNNNGGNSNNNNNLIPVYEKGYPLGFIDDGIVYLNNHLRFRILYTDVIKSTDNNNPNSNRVLSRIVGFEVESYSVDHQLDETTQTLSTCSPLHKVEGKDPNQQLDSIKTNTVYYTYDVEWIKSNIKWSQRWDIYLHMNDSKIHWFSIINSIMIVFFLTLMIAIIMIRTLRKDLARYNQSNNSNSVNSNLINNSNTTITTEQISLEEQQEETGWKLIHGDVFRTPAHSPLLCSLIGSGVQLLAMSLSTICFSVLGFLSPANRGSLLTGLLIIFVCMSILSGFISTTLLKSLKFASLDWKRQSMYTALGFPGLVYTIFFLLNLFIWQAKSAAAVPFFTLILLLVLWLGISLPLNYCGSYLAWRRPIIEPPVKVNNIARLLVPNNHWYTNPILTVLLGGILPFAAVFIEIFFIMSSIWLNQYYYLFGFLLLVFGILIVTCAEISIVLCYFQLVNEDYNWWWRSFLTPAASALYLFAYSILYFCTKLAIVQFVSGLLFFGYMALISIAFALLTGTIGFIASWIFVRTIYAAIKIE